ncbi:hypothetical protein AURDEDRAFT_70246 [Auricularia subglabra TFB-10046 SS5]|nr:hypothetical protein AURDEDRAFT_70246 [Auricularia subglabra TFB-10046 SS5]
MDWEPPVDAWDAALQHYWRARHIKVIEIAVAPCGVPLSWTKFPFAESETNIIQFMDTTWPQPHMRPTYLAIDKGCKVIQTLHATGRLFPANVGWARTTNIKVATFHYSSHVADQTCVELCNPTDRRDPNLVHLGAALPPPQTYKRWFNFEAAEQLNAWLEPFSATMTKMKPQNHAVFLCIILRERALWMST